jgi:hypothetical protein
MAYQLYFSTAHLPQLKAHKLEVLEVVEAVVVYIVGVVDLGRNPHAFVVGVGLSFLLPFALVPGQIDSISGPRDDRQSALRAGGGLLGLGS